MTFWMSSGSRDFAEDFMIIELRVIDNDNRAECEQLSVSSEQKQYIASNVESLVTAEDNAGVARPFAVYADGKMVGFTMLAFDENYEDPNDRYWLWRLMIDHRLQQNGYGTAALQAIIRYFKDHGANNIRLSTKETNTHALSMYRKAGFRDTGEMNGEETVLQLDLY